ncbi:hypothetical protein PVL30_001984 [Lodderomyces elongisporus]|uniref:uncharacterized protein n=1 Tax=Lodderomyces elongisporus TaxID=36914 RepID=UPI00291D696F|nr:uncharacterized protein PVL30_001984 [Lodderomyces elongisporus]WLF78252.1 hypothetical protein PVL30_001984 [Lodderomyces elongisporus]
MRLGDHLTFLNEDKLPTLPVPPLESTVVQALAALKPIIPYEEYEAVLDEASEFLEHEVIQLIQQHLVAIGENPKAHNNYLDVVNNHMTPAIYSVSKSDILPKNPYLILEEDPYSKTIHPPNQAERSANLINSTLKFIITVRNGTLKPDVTPKNGTPLTMSCYRNLFGTARIPDFDGNSSDITMTKYKDINDSRHILIISNNQFYKLDVIGEYTEEEYAETKSKHKILFHDHELADIFQRIIDASDVVDSVESINNAIGSITSQNLKNWKEARFELEQSNAEQMKLIDDALLVLVLDSNSPQNDQEKTMVISHGTTVLNDLNVQVGTCTSRWYDKLQLVVTRNSVAGVVWESLTMDSTAILRFISDIYTDSVLKLAKNINGSEYTLFDPNVAYVSSLETKPEAELILFNISNELQHIIHLSETHLADLIAQHEYKTHTIKLQTRLAAKFDLSVDSIMQICFQIANYSLYGRMVNTLEPITTRKFKDARTELIPIQNDSIATLCKLYITSADADEKFELFKRCCELHKKQYQDAMLGKGFERHFMSIVQILKKPECAQRLNAINTHLPPIPDLAGDQIRLPLLFNSCIDTLSRPELLISNCGNPALRLFGIPPAIDQGFGIAYIIHHDKIKLTVCSKHRQTDRLLDTFHRVVHDLKVNLRSRTSSVTMALTDSQQRRLELQKLRVEHELSKTSLDTPTTHPIQLDFDNDASAVDVTKRAKEVSNGDTLPPPAASASAASGSSIPIKVGPQTKPGRGNRRKDSSSDDNDDDAEDAEFELMGGYGYFDYGNLDLRPTEELLRSHMSSHFNSQVHSNISSALSSRHHSQTNLNKMDKSDKNGLFSSPYDLKQKATLSDRIRSQLSHSADSLARTHSNLAMSTPSESQPVKVQVGSEDEAEADSKPEREEEQGEGHEEDHEGEHEEVKMTYVSPFVNKSTIGRRLDISHYH